MTSLLGIHDIEAAGDTPQGTWIVDTIALSEHPQPRDYRHDASGLNVIVRANWGYGSTGTLPEPDYYFEYIDELTAYVSGSKGCHRWIIGNEPSLSREWPNGQPIMPADYAHCYSDARIAIHQLAGHEQDEVLVAGSGPWNAELTYPGNERGDWVTYTLDCLRPLGTDCDGVCLHSYCHGYDPALAASTARMDAPFQDRYYNFLTFTDYLRAFPAILSGANFYITEANGDSSWVASGLIPAMLAQVDAWNQREVMKVQCLICYRFPAYDQYYMQGKADVMAEYVSATHLYETPPLSPTGNPPGAIPTPPDVTAPGGGEEPPRQIDPRLYARGAQLQPALVAPGQQYWRVTKAEWYNEQEAQGRVNTFVTVLDANGQLVKGATVRWYWQSGHEDKVTEVKHDPWLGHDYSCDFPMYNVAPSYGVKIANGATDDVWGMGLGSIEQPDYKIHTAYSFTFQLVTASEPEPPIPPLPVGHPEWVLPLVGANLRAEPVDGRILTTVAYHEVVIVLGEEMASDGFLWKSCNYPRQFTNKVEGFIRGDLLSTEKPAPPQPFPPGGDIVHPIPGATITTHWGEPAPEYTPGMWGHSGTDLAAPRGTPIRAMAAGTVVLVDFDEDGLGNVLRIAHRDKNAFSLYAHCDAIDALVGRVVAAGETIARVGSTGNSSGPHCHFEIREMDEAGNYSPLSPMPSGRVDPETWCCLRGLKL